jgi:L-amino acid N-acyltransferase
MTNIRPATTDDLAAINDIYNEAALHTTATFDTDPRTMDDRRAWFAQHGRSHPVLVAEESGAVVGWASLSAYSDRKAYDGLAELSVYVHVEHRGRGIGKLLTQAILEAGRLAGLHSVLSRIAADNHVSIYLHEKMGFRTMGVLKEAGFKFNRWIDVVFMQRMY